MNPILIVTLRALGRGRRLLVVGLLMAVPALLSIAEAASTMAPTSQEASG